jgi:molybdopterin converting factor small subunit
MYNLRPLVKVNVKLFASIRKFSVKDNLEINIEEGSSVKDLLSKIGIPEDEPLLVILNEYTRGKETLLQDGDTLCLFPIIAGG